MIRVLHYQCPIATAWHATDY